MNILNGFLHSEVIGAAFFSWLIAQVLKASIYFIIHRDFRAERLLGDGGMPSSHSATAVAMTVALALCEGTGSPVFALALVFSMVVMHDAMGVRLETGKQAAVINDMINLFTDMGRPIPAEEKLKEFVGHTPSQVFFGALLGFAVALIIHFTGIYPG